MARQAHSVKELSCPGLVLSSQVPQPTCFFASEMGNLTKSCPTMMYDLEVDG